MFELSYAVMLQLRGIVSWWRAFQHWRVERDEGRRPKRVLRRMPGDYADEQGGGDLVAPQDQLSGEQTGENQVLFEHLCVSRVRAPCANFDIVHLFRFA